MQAGEIDDRMSRRPIERYQWPLGGALLVFGVAFLLRERRREQGRAAPRRTVAQRGLATTVAVLLLFAGPCLAAAPGLDAYRNDNYTEAYQQFEKTLKEHPNTQAADRIEFDAGTAAYKLRNYNQALEWFSRSLLSQDKTLQEKSHYNIGRTLEERADTTETNEKALGDLHNAQSHYEEALKLDPNDERARANLEEVKKKIERLKQNPKKKPTPPPKSEQDKKKDQQQKDQQEKDQQQKDQQPKDQQQKDQQKKNDQDQQQQPSSGNDQKQQQAKNEKTRSRNQSPANRQSLPGQRPKAGESAGFIPLAVHRQGKKRGQGERESEAGKQRAEWSAIPSPADKRQPLPFARSRRESPT